MYSSTPTTRAHTALGFPLETSSLVKLLPCSLQVHYVCTWTSKYSTSVVHHPTANKAVTDNLFRFLPLFYTSAFLTSVPFQTYLISSRGFFFNLTKSFQKATVPYPQVNRTDSVTSSPFMHSASRPASDPGRDRVPSERQQRWWRVGLFRGMVNDFRRRAPYYWDDWKDAWDYRVVPATVYIYFAKYGPRMSCAEKNLVMWIT